MEAAPCSKSWCCGREKVKMAWRHRSRDEKILLRVIGFLVFALTCFIVAVVVMDLTFKAKIRDLEDEIDGLKSTPAPPTTTTTTTTDFTTFPDTTTEDTTTASSTTTSAPTTTPPPPTTTTTTSTVSTATSTASTESESAPLMDERNPPHQLLEALQSLLFDYSGYTSSSRNMFKMSDSDGVRRRTHGRFIIMADVQHEESKPTIEDPGKTDDSQELSSTLDIDTMEHTTDMMTTTPDVTDDEDLTTEYSEDSSTRYYSKDGLLTEREGSGGGPTFSP
ncbi:uncharacterized protein [Procambarus clarkii]|uniref:uncharacterized protein isoform X2 n=1 Tax=Procambarus clarkii TaxID=6728 RepID=UPI001E673C93|nr:bypass of stop codon protein 1-like isoform X2 [Procambarus clarkii]